GQLFPLELVPVQLLRLLAKERAPVLTESRRTRRHEWRLKQALEPGATSRKQDLRMESSWRLRSAHSAPVTVAAKIRPLLAGSKPLQTELLEQPLLTLALDVRLQLQVRLESAARQLLAEQLVELEHARRVRQLDPQPNRLVLAPLDMHGLHRCGGQRVNARRARGKRDPGPALRHVERIGNPDHTRLDGQRLPVRSMRDDRVQRLRLHDRRGARVVDAGE